MKTKAKLNIRFIACLAVAAVVLVAGVHFVHEVQVQLNARALLWQAPGG
jgi:hypothetical protein